ncbi:MAG: hypothetical protein Q7S58_05125 [Candidatus Binatus sp.]|uniref:hypothetical protein n=1 Tax=Candidatus Binatus sp. TaxID=2811406 RepID=UPI002726A2BA|nr:hypothetical protein [Candidatus Binatus sp.]MDO8431775.1 hypothetical protein [Candidatus Binatus sp.]
MIKPTDRIELRLAAIEYLLIDWAEQQKLADPVCFQCGKAPLGAFFLNAVQRYDGANILGVTFLHPACLEDFLAADLAGNYRREEENSATPDAPAAGCPFLYFPDAAFAYLKAFAEESGLDEIRCCYCQEPLIGRYRMIIARAAEANHVEVRLTHDGCMPGPCADDPTNEIVQVSSPQ